MVEGDGRKNIRSRMPVGTLVLHAGLWSSLDDYGPAADGLRGARSKVRRRRAVPERPGISGRPLPAWRHRRFESEYA